MKYLLFFLASFIKDDNANSQNNSPDNLQSTTYGINSSIQTLPSTLSTSNHPSTLLIESYHWNKSIQGDPMKYLETTGTSSISLLLSFSRYCYKLIIYAPLGYIITILGRQRSFIHRNDQFIKSSNLSNKDIHQSINILFDDYDYILLNGITICPLLIKYYANQLIHCMYNIGQAIEVLVHLTEIYVSYMTTNTITTTTTTNTTTTITNHSNNNNSSIVINNTELNELEFKDKFKNAINNLITKENELKQLLSIWPNQKDCN
ncbi:unnamed protein product [Schistosoma mattheei]|uniref:Androglobin domain-containing protein n=1 Tax=Schistosoma mattheei TaxID=31246 RepID=A0A3P8DDB1_9TREM|nr:unnamed protein product [Schistosoma mattheei]